MSQKMTKIVLIFMLPAVAAWVLYTIDPDLIDPSSDQSLFAVFSTIDQASGAAGMDIDLSKTNSSADLLSVIRRSFETSDSLRVAQSGERDVMRPLVSLEIPQRRATRQVQAPKPVAKFPLSRKDVRGIIYNPRSPEASQAFIMGQRYKVGDEVKGARIAKIDKNSITFSFLNKQITIDLSSKLN